MPSKKITKKQTIFINKTFCFIMRHSANIEAEEYITTHKKVNKYVLIFVVKNHKDIRKLIFKHLKNNNQGEELRQDIIAFDEELTKLIMKKVNFNNIK